MNRRSRTCTGRNRLLGARCMGAAAGVDSLLPATRATDPRLFRESGVDDLGALRGGWFRLHRGRLVEVRADLLDVPSATRDDLARR